MMKETFARIARRWAPDEKTRALIQRWTDSPASDLAARACLVAVFLVIEYAAISALLHYVATHEPSGLFYANVAARAVTAVFVATVVAFVVLRRRAVRKARGVLPRATALAGTFLTICFPLFPAHELSLATGALSVGLVIAGETLALVALYRLGRSISLMAEARELVTSGPYAVVRHPLYVAEELATVGVWLQYASPLSALVLVCHGLLQLKRMANEERVLSEAFSEYDAYARRTRRLIPGLY